MISITSLLRQGQNFLNDNAPAILTAFGVVGTVGGAVLSAKAAFEAAEKIASHESAENAKREAGVERIVMSKTEKVKLTWPLFVPAATTCTLSVGAIVMSHRISSRRAAVLAAAYALNQDKLEEYQDKVKEKFGVKKEKETRDEIAQQHVNQAAADGFAFANPLAGKVWIMEDYTGRPFLSTVEAVKQAVNEINSEINAERSTKNGYRTLDDFYKKLGLEPTSLSHAFGWTREDYLSIDWSTTTSPDGNIAVHVFEYVGGPVMNPQRAAADDESFR